MKTISATEANRQFSKVLRDAKSGQTISIVSRGTEVAKVIPPQGGISRRQAAKKKLTEQLRKQPVTGKRTWARGELYE